MSTNFPALISTMGLILLLSTGLFAAGAEVDDLNSEYVGSGQCRTCHDTQYQSWQRSHHAKSMLPASETSVSGNFDNVRVTDKGLDAHFSRRDGGYYVYTQGVDGRPAEFEIKYTFGFEPLQQYLVAFPGGKLQTLPWTWDTEKQRWYYLQDPVPEHDDWLHWSNGAMNWNAMCSDCHSTNLHKNFRPESQTYNTSWSEINVGCEACHGPGKQHLELMQKAGDGQVKDKAILMGQSISPTALVDQCGRCHARRSQLTSNFDHQGDSMLDHYLPEILRPGLYHGDGQINDEVFVYGSFTQSKMYRNGISCRNCHDPHSGALLAEGNKLCTTCHVEQTYNSTAHHHHQAQSEGAQCVSCHMPGKFYMGVDFRHDHSFRAPRPDLTVAYGTPNACDDCHEGKGAGWAADKVIEWFGEERAPHFSEVLALAATDLANALPQLVSLLEDQSQPAIARATAAFWLAQGLQFRPVQQALVKAMEDGDPLVRFHAITALEQLPAEQRIALLLPSLEDTVRAVRIAAASGTARTRLSALSEAERKALEGARQEQRAFMDQNADFASGQRNLAIYYEKLGQLEEAESAYRRGLTIDNRDTASRINLAHLLYSQKKYQDAVSEFKQAIKYEPGFGPAYYSLGLLLAEMKQFGQAEGYLSQAAERMPGDERVLRNLEAVRFYIKNPTR